jgi:enediyne biosynthesis protein E4
MAPYGGDFTGDKAMRRQQALFQRRGLWLLLLLGIGVSLGLGLFWLRSHERVPAQIPVGNQPLPHAPTSTSVAITSPTIRFTDVTALAGIAFTHTAGATGDKWYPETIGAGVGFLDYDGDGWPDILLINGTYWPPQRDTASGQAEPTMRLYRNRGDGTFEDVTQRAGLAIPLYGMGMAAADYDNDGDTDLSVTGYQRNLFFINNGDGTFTEASRRVGLRQGQWGSGAAFFDYDRDSLLDLVVSNYVEWTPELERGLDCTYGTPARDYCPVRSFKGQGLTLYHNRGDGTFEDVTLRAGVASEGARAFAPAILDFNEDGWPDVLVASDGTPSLLWRNRGDGTFEEVGMQTGLVLDAGGAAYAGMGIDVAYPKNDGQFCIAIGNFVGEPTTLHCRVRQGDSYHPELYAEVSAWAGIGRPTLRYVTFGLFFFDVDLDGFEDLFMVNGHVVDETRLRHVPRAQPPQLFRNLGTGRFAEIVPPAGSGLDQVLVGRGAAYADYDGDGDLDILVSQNQGPVLLLRNDTPRQAHYLRVHLQGTQSNRDGIDAEVRVYAGDQVLRQRVRTGRSYYSQNELLLTFGLGKATHVARIEIVWPSGTVDSYQDVPANTTLHAVEGKGAHEAGRPLPTQWQGTRPVKLGRSADTVAGGLPAQGFGAAPPLASMSVPAVALVPAALPEATTSKTYLAHTQAGIAAYHAERYAEAELAFEAARSLQPSEPLPYRYLADLYWRQEKPDQTAHVVQALAEVMPDAYFLDRLGSGYEESGLLGLAMLFYREAARVDPAFPSARYNLGRLLLKRGHGEQGMAQVQEALRLYPEFAEAHEVLGLAYTEQGRLDKAVSHLQQALVLHPELVTAQNHLGRLYRAQGRLDEAIQTFHDLVARHPDMAEARHNLAVAYAYRGLQELAIVQFTEALRLRSDLHAARLDLAALLLDMQRPHAAIDALQPLLAAVSQDAQDSSRIAPAEVHYRLSIAYLQTRQFAQAWQHARQAEAMGAPVAELITVLRRVAVEPQ